MLACGYSAAKALEAGPCLGTILQCRSRTHRGATLQVRRSGAYRAPERLSVHR
jgi:hypothetical protein